MLDGAHMVRDAKEPWGHVECYLNPAKLVCSCKGCRKYGICSHILAINHILRYHNMRTELRAIGKSSGSKKGGGNGKRIPPALTRAPERAPDSSDEEEERLAALGAQGM